MTRHLAQRIAQALLVLLAAFTVAFVLLQALPGDADLVVLPGTKCTRGDLAFLRAQGWDVDLLPAPTGHSWGDVRAKGARRHV